MQTTEDDKPAGAGDFSSEPGFTPEPSPHDPVPNRFSPSSLETYARCPRRYWFAHVRRTRTTQLPTAQLVLGQAVHTTLAALYKLPVAIRSYETAERILRSTWKKQPRADAFLSREDEAFWGRRALNMLRDYCAGWDLRIRPRALEEWIRAPLPGGSSEVFGKADRIDQARAGRGVEIVDYKTGRPRPEDEDLGRQIPARLYALAAFRSFEQPVHRVRYIWLAERWEVNWHPENEDLDAVERHLTRLTSQIREDRDWRPAPGAHCRWCPYAPLCPGREQSGNDGVGAL